MPDRLVRLLSQDHLVREVLAAVRSVGPKGAYVAAGFVRNRFWDSLYDDGRQFEDADVDVVYFDRTNADKSRDIQYEAGLEAVMPTGLWQVRNQARMHDFGGHAPFENLKDALQHWAETATTVGVRLRRSGEMTFVAPFGFQDLYDQVLRITPLMHRTDPQGFIDRLSKKKWQQRWPKLTVITSV